MRFEVANDLTTLSEYLPRFLALVGAERWFKRAGQLADEMEASPFRWKIVADYHWLEMAISHQCDVLNEEGKLPPEFSDPQQLAALHFAANVVEVHGCLSSKGQRDLEGRLRDGLSAETGYAALYLEFDSSRRLMINGYDVEFPDLDGRAQFDLEFSRDGFIAEVECKSISSDAGRRIHRKDFYRFMEAVSPALTAHFELRRQDVLIITLRDRLSPSVSSQADLRRMVVDMLRENAPTRLAGPDFQLERQPYTECLAAAPTHDPKAFYAVCGEVFGPNTHVAGGLTEDGGCIVVMRSEREDDTSKPLLEAMRKAATQFSGDRPAFIAVQFQEIAPADLMLPHLRRRMGILSYALFGHYGAAHVNATSFSGFGAVLVREGEVGTPGFALPNPQPKFRVNPTDAAPFLVHMSDADFAAAIGAPLPAPNISYIPFAGGPDA